MNAETDRLAALDVDHDPLTDDDTFVHEVLADGRSAMRRRRYLRVGSSALGVVCLAAVGTGIYVGTEPDTPASHQAGGASASAPAATTPSTHASAAVTHPRPAPGLALVAYHGRQLPGYKIKHVPRGYVLQGVSDSVLDIAKAGDHSSIDTFEGKLVVMLNDHPGERTGTPVVIHGHHGRINRDDGVAQLTWNDGKHDVDVQCWNNIKLTDAQLVAFAEGVTITSAAVTGHG